jgi:cell division septal protein FtsQ
VILSKIKKIQVPGYKHLTQEALKQPAKKTGNTNAMNSRNGEINTPPDEVGGLK